MAVEHNYYRAVCMVHSSVTAADTVVAFSPDGEVASTDVLYESDFSLVTSFVYNSTKKFWIHGQQTNRHSIVTLLHSWPDTTVPYKQSALHALWVLTLSPTFLWSFAKRVMENLPNESPLFIGIDLTKQLHRLEAGRSDENRVKLSTIHAQIPGEEVQSISLHARRRGRKHLLSLEKTLLFNSIKNEVKLLPETCRVVFEPDLRRRISVFLDNSGNFGIHVSNDCVNLPDLVDLVSFWEQQELCRLDAVIPPLRGDTFGDK